MHPNLDPEFATELLRPASQSDDKYSRGTVGFVTGSEKYPGAALLGIEAAFEVGIGMVSYLGPKSVSDLVLSNRPEVVLGIQKANALVLGSGISESGDEAQNENLSLSVGLDLPLVIDAGAISILDLESINSPAIITPHAGEAERLFAQLGHSRKRIDIEANPAGSAWELANLTGKLVLLKGSLSVLALKGEEPIESGPGSPHLATAGTGDVLAGMIGALAAKYVAATGNITNLILRDIALVASQLHSEAAELAAAKGEFGASKIAGAISEAINS
ncbi:MAG: NAD(P)H-hydrate dehydratase [Actinomycetota bacterium]